VREPQQGSPAGRSPVGHGWTFDYRLRPSAEDAGSPAPRTRSLAGAVPRLVEEERS